MTARDVRLGVVAVDRGDMAVDMPLRLSNAGALLTYQQPPQQAVYILVWY
jgi:hypothetical protein